MQKLLSMTTQIITANKMDYSQLPKSDKHLIKHGVTFGLEFEMVFDEDQLIGRLLANKDLIIPLVIEPKEKQNLKGTDYTTLQGWSGAYEDEDEEEDAVETTRYGWLFAYLSLLFSKYCPNEKISIMRDGYSGADYSGWSFTTDRSIEGGLSVELISPILDFTENMESRVKSIFAFIKASGAETNESTGLHVTLGSPEGTTDFDLLTFGILINDRDILDKFDRIGNPYTKGSLSVLLNKAAGKEDTDWPANRENPTYNEPDEDEDGQPTKFRNASEIQDESRYLPNELGMYDDRYFSINMSKENLIEYRGIGGDYLRKGPEIITRLIRRLCGAFVIANSRKLYEQPKVKDVVKRRISAFLDLNTADYRDWARATRRAIKRKRDNLDKQIGTRKTFGISKDLDIPGVSKAYPMTISNAYDDAILTVEYGSGFAGARKQAIQIYLKLTEGDSTFKLARVNIDNDMRTSLRYAAILVKALYKILKYIATHKVIPDDRKAEAVAKLRESNLIYNKTASKILSMIPDLGGSPAEVTKKIAEEQITTVQKRIGNTEEAAKDRRLASLHARADSISKSIKDLAMWGNKTAFITSALALEYIKAPFIRDVNLFVTGNFDSAANSIFKVFALFACGGDYIDRLNALLRYEIYTQIKQLSGSYIPNKQRTIKDITYFYETLLGIVTNKYIKEPIRFVIEKLETDSKAHEAALERKADPKTFLEEVSQEAKKLEQSVNDTADHARVTRELYNLYSIVFDPDTDKATVEKTVANRANSVLPGI